MAGWKRTRQPEAASLLGHHKLPYRKTRNRLTAAAGAGIVILAATAWFIQMQPPPTDASAQAIASSGRLYTLEPQRISSQLDISGTIGASRSIAVVAPFDGVIREKRIQLGDQVAVGDVLVVMDTSDINGRFRDAQSAYLKASMENEEMERWETGPDMLRAKRALEAAENTLATLDRQVTETKGLFDQGIVSRNEYDAIVLQRDAQRATVAGTRDDVAATVKRGNKDNRELLRLELENAQSRLSDLKQQLSGANVATAVAGIVTRPPPSGSQAQVPIEPGATVTRSTALFAIADTGSYVVTGKVDEVDVNRVKVGQEVTVQSNAFPNAHLSGQITGVSAEAGSEASDGRPASFQVRASFSTEDEALRSLIRLGMSARMTIDIYTNEQALVIPPEAVIDPSADPHVNILREGKLEPVAVRIGETFLGGVEIISGLHAGNQVLIP